MQTILSFLKSLALKVLSTELVEVFVESHNKNNTEQWDGDRWFPAIISFVVLFFVGFIGVKLFVAIFLSGWLFVIFLAVGSVILLRFLGTHRAAILSFLQP